MAHPSRDELAVLSWGSLHTKRERKVLRHLLVERCPECLAAVPPRLSTLLGLDRWRRPPATKRTIHGPASGRARAKPLDMKRHLREQRAAANRALKALEAGRSLPCRMSPLAHMWALLDRSWQVRCDDPQDMAYLAWSATAISLELDRAFYGRKRVCDFQAQAEMDFGNACRVAHRFEDAERALWRARQFFEQGTGDPLLEVRLLRFEASLLGDRRRWALATHKLLQILAFYEAQGDRHLIGRTLVTLGLYTGNEGRYEQAVEHLKSGLKLIDTKREPYAAYCAAHNLVLFLVERGCIAEAKKLRLVHSSLLRHADGRIPQLHFRGLEGRIAAGEGNHQRAESIFSQLAEAFAEAGLPCCAGIARLDLAIALLHQSKAEEAEQTVMEAAEIFSVHKFELEGLQAVILLRDAFRRRTATLAMAQEVAAFVRRLVYDPDLRFEARAWEGE